MDVRPVGPAEDRAVEQLFLATFVLGRPLPFEGPDADAYVDLCLGWHLGPGRDDLFVLAAPGRVVGAALLCTDDRERRRWTRPAATAWTWQATKAVYSRRLGEASEQFHRLRLKDGWADLAGPPPPYNARLQILVPPAQRRATAARLLIEAAEERLRAVGATQWYGEIDVTGGRQGAAIGRPGARIVHRRPNLTQSWLAGQPVERLRFTREVRPPASAPVQSQPLRRNARYSSDEAVAIPASTSG